MAKLQKVKTFNFTVKLGQIKDLNSVFPTNDSGTMIRLNLPVTDGKSVVYVSQTGFNNAGKSFKTQFVYENGERKEYKTEEVKWEDRFNADLIGKLSPFKKYVLSTTEGERQEFMTSYDLILAIKDAMIQGKLVNDTLYIRGDFKKNKYVSSKTGKTVINDVFEVQSIMVSKSEKLFMGGEMTFLFRDEALDIESGKAKKQVYVDGYIQDYDKDIKGDNMYQQVFVMDYSHFDSLTPEVREAEVKKFSLMKQCLTRTSGVHEFGFVVEFVKGSVEAELKQEDLTEFEAMCLENGYTMEDIKKARGMKKEYTNEIRLISPLLSRFPRGTVAHEDLTVADLKHKDAVSYVSVAQIDSEPVFGTVEITPDDLPF